MGNDNVKDYPPYLDYPKPRKPQTNADKLRAMSDEELAAYIDEHTAEAMWCNNPPLDCPQDRECVDCILDWLRKEASYEP